MVYITYSKKNSPPQPKEGVSRLLELAGTKKKWLISSVIFSVIATIAKFVPIIASFNIIKELSLNASDFSTINVDLISRYAYYALGGIGLYGIFMYIGLMCSHIAAFNILYEVRVKLSEKLTRLPMGFFTKKSSGEIKKNMTESVEEIELFLAHHIPDIASATIFPIMVYLYLFIVDWALALATFVPILLMIWVMARMSNESKVYQLYHDSLENINKNVVEYVRGMPVVKIFNTTTETFSQLKQSMIEYKNFSQKISKDYSKVYPGVLTLLSSALVFILPVSTIKLSLSEGSLQSNLIPIIFLFMIIGGGLFFPFYKLMFMGNYLKKITEAVKRIDSVFYEDEVESEQSEIMPKNHDIEFKNVVFAYEDKNVLKNISFTAEGGTITALVGPSGAGKTTIGYLLARFWDPNKGVICLGGVDIKKIGLDVLMENISFLFQDVYLFYDTIENNIRMGNQKISKEKIVKVAKAAQCHDFIMDLPEGYNTLIGEGGTYLSGGEAQRVGIARVLLKNAPVLILDEATAFADPENEGKILDGFSQLIKSKTVIVIAHRLSTITNADKIIVIDEGTLKEQGKHEQLIEKNGLYNNMWTIYNNARQWRIIK